MRKREKTEMVTLRASPDFMALVDEWRRNQPDIPTRAEAIRRLVAQGFIGDIDTIQALLVGSQRWLELARDTSSPVPGDFARQLVDAMQSFLEGLRATAGAHVIDEDGVAALEVIVDQARQAAPTDDT